MSKPIYDKELSEIDPEELGFITALSESPNEMTTRLVYADWLQERDDPRHRGYRATVSMNVVLSCAFPQYTPAQFWFAMSVTKGGSLSAAWIDKVPDVLQPRQKAFRIGNQVMTNVAGTVWWDYRAFVVLETIVIAFPRLAPHIQERYLGWKDGTPCTMNPC